MKEARLWLLWAVILVTAAPTVGQLRLDKDGYFRNGSSLVIPAGVNYWPASTGCNLWRADNFPVSEIKHDFEILAVSPFNTIRIFVDWSSFEPSPGVYNDTKFGQLSSMLRWAEEAGLWIDVSCFMIWMSGVHYWPSWKEGNIYTDSNMIARTTAFALKVSQTAAAFASSLLALEYGNEMDCCTDPAPAEAVISWTHNIYGAFKHGCSSTLVIPGTDEGTIFGDTGWSLGGPTGRIAGDVLNLHPYPVLFTPTKGDGFYDGVTQAGPTYDTSFVRAYGPVFMQEWGTLITGGTHQQDSYLRAILPEALGNGANGFLYWCMRDINDNHTLPYSAHGKETTLGLFNSDDRIKPGLEFFGEFARNLSIMKHPPTLPENDPEAIGLYVPLHYYQNGDPVNKANNYNTPPQQAGHATLAYYLLRSLGEKTRVIRGDTKLPKNLKVLVVTSAYLVPAEISILKQWVEMGGKLIWHGLSAAYFPSADVEAMVGAVCIGNVSTSWSPRVSFGQTTYETPQFMSRGVPELKVTNASRVWRDLGSQRPVATLTSLAGGHIFSALPAIDASTLSVAGVPASRDKWQCWYKVALSCVRATSGCIVECTRNQTHEKQLSSHRLSGPAPFQQDRDTIISVVGSQELVETAVNSLSGIGIQTNSIVKGLNASGSIKGDVLIVLASMTLPEIDVALEWLDSMPSSRCMIWSGFDTHSMSHSMWTAFGVAPVDVRTPLNSTFSVFGQDFTMDRFGGPLHVAFDTRFPQQPEWGRAKEIAVDDRGIPVIHRLQVNKQVRILSSPSAEQSSLSVPEREAWYKGMLHLCSTDTDSKISGIASPYPYSAFPTKELIIYSEVGLDSSDMVTLETLGGGLARNTPQLYRVPTSVNGTDSYALWLREMQAHFGVSVDTSLIGKPATSVLERFKNRITGIVKYNGNDGSDNAALTFIAGQTKDDLLVASASPATISKLENLGIKIVRDCSGESALDMYKLRGVGAFNGNLVSFQLPQVSTSNLAEYAVFAGAPTIDYACSGNSTPACFKQNGIKGGPAAELVAANLGRTPGVKVALGWGPESAYVSTLGENGIYVHASDDAHDVSPVANIAVHGNLKRSHHYQDIERPSTAYLPVQCSSSKHKVAFLMSDGDNIQWMYNNFATDAQHWGSQDRGKVPMGWTISPALVKLGPVILNYLASTKSQNDDFVGAPSGIGYTYPSTWPSEKLEEFAELTGEFMNHTETFTSTMFRAVNVIGDPCINGTYFPGCAGLNSPNLDSLGPLLDEEQVDGLFWYTFGAGYSGWSGTQWGGTGLKKKPVIGGRVSLWGEATVGTMLGVKPLVEHLKVELALGKLTKSSGTTNGYSIIPVHAWSHNVSDVVVAAALLESTGNFQIIKPTELLHSVSQCVTPGH